MARIRTIKPEFWSHHVMGRASDSQKCMAIALLNHADDEGYFLADPSLVRSACRPFDEESRTSTVLIRDMSVMGWIEVCKTAEGVLLGRIVKFRENQVINKPKRSKLRESWDDTLIVRYESGNVPTGNGKEQGKEVEQNHSKRLADFDVFWDAFGFKQGKGGAEKSWLAIKNYSPELFKKIITAAKAESDRRPSLIAQNKTPKWAQGWITEKRWEDEPVLFPAVLLTAAEIERDHILAKNKRSSQEFGEMIL